MNTQEAGRPHTRACLTEIPRSSEPPSAEFLLPRQNEGRSGLEKGLSPPISPPLSFEVNDCFPKYFLTGAEKKRGGEMRAEGRRSIPEMQSALCQVEAAQAVSIFVAFFFSRKSLSVLARKLHSRPSHVKVREEVRENAHARTHPGLPPFFRNFSLLRETEVTLQPDRSTHPPFARKENPIFLPPFVCVNLLSEGSRRCTTYNVVC